MRLFRRKTQVVEHQLSDKSYEAISTLAKDVQDLHVFVRDLANGVDRLARAVLEEIAEPEDGVQVFEGERPRPPLPKSHVTGEGKKFPDDDPRRVRSSPVRRVPRAKQFEWLQAALADGEWTAAVTLAREYAESEDDFRYLRSAIGSRMRELYELGGLERRDSSVKGAVYEYRKPL